MNFFQKRSYIKFSIYFFVLFFFQVKEIFSQEKNLRFLVAQGVIFPHHSAIEYVANNYVQAFSLRYEKKTFGAESWETGFRYPAYGFGLYHENFHNKNVLGSASSVFIYIHIPIQHKEKFNFFYSLSGGFSYLNKPYDIADNYLNTAIGSRFNNFIHVGYGFQQKISSNLKLESALTFKHYSNGRRKFPNTGLNVFSFEVGILYRIGERSNYIENELPTINKKWSLSAFYGMGDKANTLGDNKFYLVSMLQLNLERWVSYKRNFGLGVDLFFDQTLKYRVEEEGLATSGISDLLRPAIHVSQDLKMGKLALSFQLGYYLFSTYKENNSIYNNMIIKYYISEKVFFNIIFKSHFAKADFMAFGIGWTF